MRRVEVGATLAFGAAAAFGAAEAAFGSASVVVDMLLKERSASAVNTFVR